MVGLFSQLLSVVSSCPHATQMQYVQVQLCVLGPTESSVHQESPAALTFTSKMLPMCMIMLAVTKLHQHRKAHDSTCLERGC